MKAIAIAAVLAVAAMLGANTAEAQWPAPQAPAVPEADGYVVIPHAAVAPDKARTYRAVFDANRGADKPDQLLPALNMAGSELNALAVSGVPPAHAKFAIVFHGAAIDGILDEAHYKAKFGVSNPNLKVISKMKKAGTEVFVCGQNLAFAGIDPATLTPDVTVASDALIVLMTYQADGYALLSF